MATDALANTATPASTSGAGTASAEDGGPQSMTVLRQVAGIERSVRQFNTLTATEAATMLAEYADRTPSSDESDWEFFVRHNWLPLLQLVHGSDWANQFGSEVPAMLALHTALVQAGAGAQRPQPPKPAPPVASPPARPQYLPESSFGMVSNRLPVDSYPSSPLSPHVEGDGSDDGSGGARAFTVEAVDIDGKRRRLRRKRAASPEEDAVSAALLPASRGKPLNGDIYLPGRQEAPPAAAPEAGRHDAVQSSVEAAATSAAAFKAVIDKLRQIKLDLSGEAEGSGADKAGGGEGEGEGSGAPAREDDSPTGVAAATGLEKGVLDMLTTVHGLSQRISFTTGLRDAPTQAPLPVAAAGSQAPTAADSDPQGALAKIKDLREKMNTLTRLLRCSFGDRTDVFGRTAMHVAAATGRADIVAALVGAGCDPNKTLPLDYRILERHGLARGKPPQQAVSAPEGVVAGDPAWKGGIERRPWPRKRARLSTGPPAPGPEIYSMQYSTPLHWAAARGDIACLEALLGTPSLDVNVPTLQGATALHIAAAGGRVAAVARLCRAPGINIDAVDMRKRTALHYAAAAGHVGVVEQLWARGACIDPADSASWRPLHYAVCSGFTEVASSLVIAGSQVQAYDTDGVTAAHLAAERGFTAILEKLLMAGFMPDAVAAPFSSAGDGTTALHLAASSGHANCVALLLQWAARPHAVDAMGCSPLDCAVMNGHFAAALPLLAAGCTLRCAELLDAAAEEEDKAESASPQSKPTAAVEEARLAESEGSDYTSDSDANGELEQTAEGAGGTPPRRPPPPPLPDRVHRILSVLGNTTPQSTHPDVGALSPSESLYRDFFNTDVSVFAAAASGGLVPTLRYFIEHSTSEHGTPICPDLDQALLLAVRGNHTATVRFLLDECGCTPEASEHHALVHHAAALGHIEVLSLLINAGWDATKTHAGTTALHEAVIYGHTGFVEALLDIPGMDALVDHSDRNGWTALHYAAASGMTSAIKCLLEHGARVDIPLPNGMTAAHLAAQKEFDDALYMLLDAGADLGAVDGQSWLPLHYVAQRGDLANFILLYPGTARHLTAGPQGAANAQGATLLTAAVQGLSPEMVGALLRSTPGLKQACAAAGETPVHAAAREGSIYALYFLWESVCGMFDMAAADEEGRTPLHHVPTGYGHAKTKAIAPRLEHFVACADMLLKAGCKVDAPDKHSCTPLHIAAGCGSDEILRKFIRLSTDVNAADEIGWTPLFWAASEGHASAVRMLLAKGADPLAEDCNMRLPLHFAAEGGHLACVNALIDAILAGGPKTGGGQSDSGRLAEQAMYVHRPDQNGQAPVNIAAEAHFVDVVAALLDAVPFSNDQLVAGPRDAEAKRRNALHLAAAQGLDDVVPHLLASRRLHPGAKDNDGWMPLHHAAAAGHTTVVGQLLAACWNMEDMMAVNGDTPLHRAALNGHTDCVVEMLKMRCAVDAVNSSGATPLYNAASQGHVNVMRALIEGGANVDAAATNGCTPLYIAANNGFHEAVELLLQEGATPDLQSGRDGCTSMHAAAHNGHVKVITALAAGGADVDVQSNNGTTPLHNAATNGSVEAVEALLAAGADADIENQLGNTPMHMAAGKGWAEVVEKLVEGGADFTLRNQKGHSAVQSAANCGSFDTVLRLVRLGAAWRLKGDIDVVKTLTRKTTLKTSYIEGRLRLAEKERHRKGAAKPGQGVGSGAEGGGTSDGGTTDGERSKEQIEAAKAQADAVMEALLQEEMAEKAKVERQAAKKQAKKQKKAAQKAAEEEAKAKAEQAEQERAAKEAEAQAAKLQEAAIAAPSKPAADAEVNGHASDASKYPQKQVPGKAKAAPPSPIGPVAKAQSLPHIPVQPPPPASLPSRRASDGLASAPAMPMPTSAPPPTPAPAKPAPPVAPAKLATARPAGPYAAALAGQQPPPPRPAPPVQQQSPKAAHWATTNAQAPAEPHPAQPAMPALPPGMPFPGAPGTQQQVQQQLQAPYMPPFEQQPPAMQPQTTRLQTLRPVQRQQQAAYGAQQGAQQAQQGYMPLFGFDLPMPSGLGGVDWASPVGVSMHPQLPPHSQSLPMGRMAQPQTAYYDGMGSVGVLPGMGGAMGGGFSPSVPSVHSSLDNMSHGMGFMGPETGSVGSHASVYGSVGAPRGDGGGVLPGDADGIDDVLRLQPWLQDG